MCTYMFFVFSVHLTAPNGQMSAPNDCSEFSGCSVVAGVTVQHVEATTQTCSTAPSTCNRGCDQVLIASSTKQIAPPRLPNCQSNSCLADSPLSKPMKSPMKSPMKCT